MPTVTATEFKAILNLDDDTDFTATYAEYILDQAINLLNLALAPWDLEVSNMSGDAGSMTLTVDKKTKAAIYEVAAAVYSEKYKASGSGSSSESYTLGPASASSSSTATSGASGASGNARAVAKEVAHMLRDQTLEVSFG